MNVAVHGHGAGDPVIALHAANGDGHVVDHAEAFAVVGEGMMKSAADIEGNSIVERIIGGKDGTSGGEPEGAHQFGRVGNFKEEFLPRGKGAGLKFLHVLRSMDKQHVLI